MKVVNRNNDIQTGRKSVSKRCKVYSTSRGSRGIYWRDKTEVIWCGKKNVPKGTTVSSKQFGRNSISQLYVLQLGVFLIKRRTQNKGPRATLLLRHQILAVTVHNILTGFCGGGGLGEYRGGDGTEPQNTCILSSLNIKAPSIFFWLTVHIIGCFAFQADLLW